MATTLHDWLKTNDINDVQELNLECTYPGDDETFFPGRRLPPNHIPDLSGMIVVGIEYTERNGTGGALFNTHLIDDNQNVIRIENLWGGHLILME